MAQNVDDNPDNALQQLKRALARWDNEGGAEPQGSQTASPSVEGEPPMPEYGKAEVGALHIRVIALENLLVALLAVASDSQIEVAVGMADYVAPRPGFTHHPLTTGAAAHMVDLVDRASRFRDAIPFAQQRSPS